MLVTIDKTGNQIGSSALSATSSLVTTVPRFVESLPQRFRGGILRPHNGPLDAAAGTFAAQLNLHLVTPISEQQSPSLINEASNAVLINELGFCALGNTYSRIEIRSWASGIPGPQFGRESGLQYSAWTKIVIQL